MKFISGKNDVTTKLITPGHSGNYRNASPGSGGRIHECAEVSRGQRETQHPQNFTLRNEQRRDMIGLAKDLWSYPNNQQLQFFCHGLFQNPHMNLNTCLQIAHHNGRIHRNFSMQVHKKLRFLIIPKSRVPPRFSCHEQIVLDLKGGSWWVVLGMVNQDSEALSIDKSSSERKFKPVRRQEAHGIACSDLKFHELLLAMSDATLTASRDAPDRPLFVNPTA
ncbi:hypothetical protein SADUNF_Sadunf08G0144000 [Salix dunnii]|uniref:Uncharacterized protein n=1 Tax=Salix dunnii TaxID=1413687 RepID=A0A835JXA7_9ROSI|nr:hypothetical protein SADUNF_Sadunf08G0144000 [Salix dunnii]